MVPKKSVRGSALKRRARWLERKISEGERPGISFDTAEYAELLWVFEALGISYTPQDEGGEPPVRGGDEPPRIDARCGRGDNDTFVPGEPRRARYVPRGGF